MLLLLPCRSVPGAGDEVVAGDSVGLMPQGPGQQPMGPAQLAALLRWGWGFVGQTGRKAGLSRGLCIHGLMYMHRADGMCVCRRTQWHLPGCVQRESPQTRWQCGRQGGS